MVTTKPITIADEVWIATALLHREQPDRADFTIHEIQERVTATSGSSPRWHFATHLSPLRGQISKPSQTLHLATTKVLVVSGVRETHVTQIGPRDGSVRM